MLPATHIQTSQNYVQQPIHYISTNWNPPCCVLVNIDTPGFSGALDLNYFWRRGRIARVCILQQSEILDFQSNPRKSFTFPGYRNIFLVSHYQKSKITGKKRVLKLSPFLPRLLACPRGRDGIVLGNIIKNDTKCLRRQGFRDFTSMKRLLAWDPSAVRLPRTESPSDHSE